MAKIDDINIAAVKKVAQALGDIKDTAGRKFTAKAP